MRAKPLVLPALLTALSLGFGALAAAPASAAAAPVELGTAASFGVLGASTVTNTGPTLVGGDLGLSPGTAVTGFPPGQVTGTLHVADAVALQAQSDTTTAYDSAAGRPSDRTVSADLAGQTLLPGVHSGATLALNGTLTLDGANDPDAVFIFQSGSSLITGPNSSVALVRGASACNVFWQVGSSATLGVGTDFQGTVAALTSITAETGAQVTGRLLARTGAVTLDTNTISRPSCALAAAPAEPAPSSPAPSPSPDAPASPAPASPAPAEPAPASPAPADPTPTSPAPADPTPTTPAPAEPAPASPAPAPVSSPLPSTPPGTSTTPSPAAPPLTVPGAATGDATATAPAAPGATGGSSPQVLTAVPFEGAPPVDLTGGTTDTSTASGPFLPTTGSQAEQAPRLGLAALLLGTLLTLIGRRPRHTAHR